MDTELVKIEVTPPLVEINYQEARAQLQTYLEQYDVVVTDETLKKSKELATDINKQRKAMKERLDDAVKAAGAPIQDLRDKVKELDGMWEDARQKILSQVAQHEQKIRDLAEKLLIELRHQLWEENEIADEFRAAKIDHLVKISSVTGNGALTKAAKDDVLRRVQANKNLQLQTEKRILELENRSYRAGLGAPLTREHVANFLYEDDDVYAERLKRLLDTEVKRDQEAKAKWEREKEQEAARKPATEPQKDPDKNEQKQQDGASVEPAKKPDGKQDICVVATFKTQVKPSVTNDAIKTELTKKLKQAGVTTLNNITIHRE